MIALFGTNTPESSKMCQKVKAFFMKCPEIHRRETFYSVYAQNLRKIYCNVFLSQKSPRRLLCFGHQIAL